MSSKRVRVAISDDHPLICDAIKLIISSDSDLEFVGQAKDVAGTIELVKELAPDILLLDISLSNSGGFEALDALAHLKLPTKTIILTMYEDDTRVFEAFQRGAYSYLVKDCQSSEIIETIKKVSSGSFVISKRFTHLENTLLNSKSKKSRRILSSSTPLNLLSKRERQIFLMLVDGLQNKLIAQTLEISPRTVETHRARIMKKFSFGSNIDLVKFAVRHNIVPV